MCVAGSPWESTSSGGPGREMSSSAETLGGESRVLELSTDGSGVESPLWTGALDSSGRERTGEPWWETGTVQTQLIHPSLVRNEKSTSDPQSGNQVMGKSTER